MQIRFIRLAVTTNRRYGQDGGGYLAAAMTYYAFLSLFPMLLLGLSVVGFLLAGDPAAQATWADRLSGSIPGLGPLIGRNLHALVQGRAGTGIVGLVGLLFAATGLTQAAGHALSRIHGVPEQQGIVRQKAWALASTIGLGILALMGIAIATAAGAIRAHGAVALGLRGAAAVIAFGVDLGLFVTAYRVLLPGRKGPGWRQLLPGAVLAAIGWTLLKIVGAWYATHTVARSSAVYGTFASVIGVLLLLYLAARLFLYGAELNQVLIEERGGHMDAAGQPAGGGRAESLAERNGQRSTVPPGQRSTPQLIRDIAGDTATLVRKEVQLARQELVEGIAGRMKAAAGMVLAGVLGIYVLAFLGLAAATALDQVVAPWLSRLIVAAGFGAIAALAALAGRAAMRKSPVPVKETARTVKENVEWAKTQLKR